MAVFKTEFEKCSTTCLGVFSLQFVFSNLVPLKFLGKHMCNKPRIYDFIPRVGNPRFYQCMLDEDMIRRATCIVWCIFVVATG